MGFSLELNRNASGDTSYILGRRISENASGVQGGLFKAISDKFGTFGQEFSFYFKVTDAGAETTSSGKARIEVSVVQGGTTNLLYDTATDPDLAGTGFKFFRASRYIFFQIPNDSGPATYDNIGLNWLSGPTHEPEVVMWTGVGANDNWSTGANWSSGSTPGYLDHLLFSGTTRQVNQNEPHLRGGIFAGFGQRRVPAERKRAETA